MQTNWRETWQPRVKRFGATACIVGLALVKLGQKLMEDR
jgi:hypothetical protein